ncbi:glycine zipper 2TM domain-containing protein [Novosphingobium sp. B 225]|uniref:glycine zipper 2TM domain-containing protein n=1 Tax=Novosphingobium sp. B 225 TaxID=1961849 RepID=UPI000B4BD74D|nr:glycine zipper 2TM domain-containing protein [Novosphingobium sp. B 225]
MNKTVLAALIAVTALPAMPVAADPPRWAPAHGNRHHDRFHDDDRRYYRTDNGIRYWRGDDGRNYCRRGDGTVGLLIGGVAGALVGRSIDTRGDRAPGTILGAAAGALIGNELGKGSSRCR